jgi:hypothetical protein
MALDSTVSIQVGVVDRGGFPLGLDIGSGGDGSGEVHGGARHVGRWW